MKFIFDISLFLVLPSIVVYCFLRVIFLKKYPLDFFKEIIRVLFISYIIFLVYFVWLMPTAIFETIRYNFVPFSTILMYVNEILNGNIGIGARNLFGNILLTFPFGVFIYLTFGRCRRIYIFCVALCIPIVIELGQLIFHLAGKGTRSIDIDDIILNALGIFIGYITMMVGLRLLNIHNNRV
ncbi:hypothetical protein CU633_16340 [Bacillus sp. V3-13]|uniref:VanZ family protein n=1 Tax=Bacillus TaxID=1386 RepID=UPI000C76462A|nr:MULTISPECIES: VanZ family protein [Bacillus]PLR76265.1 hypothetical protein CU633_16340 [Bacillus sp. V3-13]RSK53958.1 VanZ family protein [Bacillus canaveralius]